MFSAHAIYLKVLEKIIAAKNILNQPKMVC